MDIWQNTKPFLTNISREFITLENFCSTLIPCHIRFRALFRSYKPLAEELQEGVLPQVVPGEVTDHVQEELANQHKGVEIDQLDFTNLAPRKPDWDLKRDIGPKLEKLERRTQRAIAELIRERLVEEDLANAVTAGASAARQLANEEED